jgi:hypothetical protein
LPTLRNNFSTQKKKSYAKSNYKELLPHVPLSKYQDEIFRKLREFIEFYCGWKNISEDEGYNFFSGLQEEALEKYKGSSSPRNICASLWISAKLLCKQELCSMLCDILRSDTLGHLQFALPLIKDISYYSMSSTEKIEWPIDRILYRGGGIPSSELSTFVSGLKYRAPSFLSTSNNRKTGELFCNRAVQRKINPILYIFNLSETCTPCFNVNKISDDEFLFLPYAVFTVRSVIIRDNPSVDNPHIIHLYVEPDSETQSDFLPLINWH